MEILLNTKPTKEICRQLICAVSEYVESITEKVNLKQDKSFIFINTITIPELVETQKYDNGNPYFEKNLSFSIRTEDIVLLNSLFDRHFIVIIKYSDGTYKIMGEIDPYNPVVLSISNNKLFDFSFSCTSSSLSTSIVYP